MSLFQIWDHDMQACTWRPDHMVLFILPGRMMAWSGSWTQWIICKHVHIWVPNPDPAPKRAAGPARVPGTQFFLGQGPGLGPTYERVCILSLGFNCLIRPSSCLVRWKVPYDPGLHGQACLSWSQIWNSDITYFNSKAAISSDIAWRRCKYTR